MSAPGESLKRTPLYTLHEELGARLVPFAGYAMPVQYPRGIKYEHLATRARAGLFDVSHMGQVSLRGEPAALEALVPSDIAGLAPGQQRYTLLTSDAGGILDDLMVTRFADRLHLVVNAAFKHADVAHLRAHLPHCAIELHEELALLALQGPAAEAVMARLAPAAAALRFMRGCETVLDGLPVLVHRCGYTGEDGFEIAVHVDLAERLARRLLAEPEVEACGLGARDSLRLEAGLCLYGHELDPTTTPIEAAIGWAIQKVRRTGGARAGGFPGADTILAQFDAGTARLRVGLAGSTRAPVREGAPLLDAGGREVGCVTSGSFGPSAGQPVAMAYVETASAAPGTELSALVRGRPVPMTVTTMPFVPQRYHRG